MREYQDANTLVIICYSILQPQFIDCTSYSNAGLIPYPDRKPGHSDGRGDRWRSRAGPWVCVKKDFCASTKQGLSGEGRAMVQSVYYRTIWISDVHLGSRS